MRRFALRKRVWVTLTAVAILLALGYFVALPWVVRGRVRAALQQLGLDDATFRVTRATPWSSTIRDIDLGGGDRVGRVHVTYSAGGLWEGRVDRVAIESMRLTATLRDGALHIEPLSSSQPATDTTAGAGRAMARDVHLRLPLRRITLDDSVLRVRTPGGELPIDARGRFVEGEIDLKLGPPTGTIVVSGSILAGKGASTLELEFQDLRAAQIAPIIAELTHDLPVQPAGTLDGRGRVTWDATRTTYAFNIRADELAGDGDRQPAGTHLRIERGVLRIEGIVGQVPADAAALRVQADELTLAGGALGASLSGVAGTVEFIRLDPPVTRSDQVIRAGKLVASKLELTDGFTQFDVSEDGVIHVDETRWNLLGGQLSSSDVRIVPGEPIAMTLLVRNLQLRDLLDRLVQGKASGNGQVNGRLPLVISPDGAVTLGEGSFEATAGGSLSVTDQDTLAAVAGHGAAAQSVSSQAQHQIREDVVAAMRDFEFHSLTARLKNEPGTGLVAYVRMKGRGRSGARQALDYDLRVTGLRDLLDSLIGLQQAMQKQQEAATP